MDKSGDNLFLALEALEKEKNIPKDYMIEKIQQALTAAYHREYSAAGEVNFVMDPKTMMMRMFALKTVADPVTDPALEISPEEAQTVSESRAPVAVGDVVRVELNTKQFGRIAAQTAKQVIIQGIRESERGAIYREYASKEQEILTAQVIKIDKRSGNMILTLPGSPEAVSYTHLDVYKRQARSTVKKRRRLPSTRKNSSITASAAARAAASCSSSWISSGWNSKRPSSSWRRCTIWSFRRMRTKKWSACGRGFWKPTEMCIRDRPDAVRAAYARRALHDDF